MNMKRISSVELAAFLQVSESELLKEARNLLGNWYQFLVEDIYKGKKEFLFMFDDALVMCEIFGKDPKKIGLTKFHKTYDIVLPEDFYIPHRSINGIKLYHENTLRYLFQVPHSAKRWIQLKRRVVDIERGVDFIESKGAIWFTNNGALKMALYRAHSDRVVKFLRD